MIISGVSVISPQAVSTEGVRVAKDSVLPVKEVANYLSEQRSSELRKEALSKEAPKEEPVKDRPLDGLSKEKAEILAKQLEEQINKKNGTQVEFRVSEGDFSFNFAVVEKETGEIVREFPPKELMAIAARAKESASEGVFVDEAA